MKNSLLVLGGVLILVISGLILIKPGSGIDRLPSESKIVETGIQKITLSFKEGNYYPNTISVNKGVPVEITLDSSVKGCYRAFRINSLGVNKYSENPEQKITFTPNKLGTFRFACTMGMGTGTIIVK